MTQLTVDNVAHVVMSRPLTVRGWIDPINNDGPVQMEFYLPVTQMTMAQVTYEYTPGVRGGRNTPIYTVTTEWWPKDSAPWEHIWVNWVLTQYWLSPDATVIIEDLRRIPASNALLHFGRAESEIRRTRNLIVPPDSNRMTHHKILELVEIRLHGLSRRLEGALRQAEEHRRKNKLQPNA